MNKKILIIGFGEMGRAIESILKEKQNIDIEIWDKDETKVPQQKPLTETVPAVDFVFICIPSWFNREALETIKPLLEKGTIVISFSKGIEQKTKKTIDEVLGEFVLNSFALIHGPMIAEELMSKQKARAIVTSPDKDIQIRVIELFSDTILSLEGSSDTHGVALAGVLKNIYSIGLGIAEALDLGTDFKGYFVQQSIEEMEEIIGLLGGEKETGLSLAGLGDFIATGFNPYSRNYSVGKEIVQTGTCCLESEGTVSFPSMLNLIGDKNKNFPILLALENILMKQQKAEIVFSELI